MNGCQDPKCVICPIEKRVKELTASLVDMVNQFAYDDGITYNDGKGKYAQSKLTTGGLSALEYAYEVLDLPDPCTRQQLWDKEIKDDDNSSSV